MTEAEQLHRDITGLLEANRLDWRELAESTTMTGEQRSALKAAIRERNVAMRPLWERYYALKP